MITGASLKSWKTIKNHVPLIKFRKGASAKESKPAATAVSGSAPRAAAGAAPPAGIPGGLIEDWQIPTHYRRAPLDQKEMDAINSGGAY